MAHTKPSAAPTRVGFMPGSSISRVVIAAREPAEPIPTRTSDRRMKVGSGNIITPAHPSSVANAIGHVNGLRNPDMPVPIPPPNAANRPVNGSTCVIKEASAIDMPR